MPVSWVARSILQAQYVLGSGHWKEVANEVGARQRDSDEDAQTGQTSHPPNPDRYFTLPPLVCQASLITAETRLPQARPQQFWALAKR